VFLPTAFRHGANVGYHFMIFTVMIMMVSVVPILVAGRIGTNLNSAEDVYLSLSSTRPMI